MAVASAVVSAAPMSNDTLAHHDTLPGGDPIGTAARAMFDGFHLEYRLGEGGMGEVWLAEQLEPVRRQVALKVIKAGMDTRRSSPASSPSARRWR